MSLTKLQIYNAAISSVGGKSRLVGLEDQTKARFECDTWYDIVRRTAMEAAHWPCCRQVARLTLSSTRDFNQNWQPGSPEPQFSYSYFLPPELLRPWHLAGLQRFSLTFDTSNNRSILSTNEKDAVLYYAVDQTEVWAWQAGLTSAIIHGLAGAIAQPLTGDARKTQMQMQLADRFLLDAQQAVATINHAQIESVPEELLVRGYVAPIQTEQYYYPFGKVFNAAVPNA